MAKYDEKINELLECVDYLSSINYQFSEEDKVLLDEFFDENSEFVIESLLDKYQNIISEDYKYSKASDKNVPKRKFKFSVPGAKFSNCYHEPDVLYYLESLYEDKFEELGFDKLGISNPHFIPSHHNFGEQLHLTYTSENSRSMFKDATFGYALEVDVDIREKQKVKC